MDGGGASTNTSKLNILNIHLTYIVFLTFQQCYVFVRAQVHII